MQQVRGVGRFTPWPEDSKSELWSLRKREIEMRLLILQVIYSKSSHTCLEFFSAPGILGITELSYAFKLTGFSSTFVNIKMLLFWNLINKFILKICYLSHLIFWCFQLYRLYPYLKWHTPVHNPADSVVLWFSSPRAGRRGTKELLLADITVEQNWHQKQECTREYNTTNRNKKFWKFNSAV
jgi:hypothetical protein